ncbi:mannitol dehydrogenase dsf1 [Fusarium falciforme]|nr:mannitol dehydrogenase dsf1 [Fusarium falciforme]
MPQNGFTVKTMLVAFAKLKKDEKFAAWIEDKVTSPNSMVDRVTPRCTDKERKYVADTWGIKDQCPVVAEPFIQWVLEDNFSDGRPPWELVGVQVVKDVDSYELMKLRLLNGGHSAMGYLGYLAGYTYIHEVVNDPTINKYIRVLMREEVIPLLPKVPGVDFEEYTASVLERFSNPAIQDTVARICLMGSGKMPKYVLPSIYEQLRKPDDMNGKPFEIEDPMAATLKAAAVKGGKDPHELLNIEVLFSPEIRDNKEFVAQLTHSLETVYDKGPIAAIKEILDQV